jgi:hypothetical protein
VFPPVESGFGTFWERLFSSHPSPYAREQNAKRFYIRSEPDDRPSWLLFRNPEAVRESGAVLMYASRLGLPDGSVLSPPEKVHAAISGGQVESSFDPRYHGLYDGRLIQPGDVAALAQTARRDPWPPQRLAQVYERLYGGKLKEKVEERLRRGEEIAFLADLDSGRTRLKAKEFEFRGVKRRPAEVRMLLRTLEAERDEERRTFADFDRDVFLAHYQMAGAVAGGAAEELLARYQAHVRLQEILEKTAAQQAQVFALIQSLSSTRRPTPQDQQRAVAALRQARGTLEWAAAASRSIQMPPLPDLSPGLPLSHYVAPAGVVPDIPTNAWPTGEWVQSLVRQLGELRERVEPVHVKSLGAVLALQERIAAAWRASLASASAARPRRDGVTA